MVDTTIDADRELKSRHRAMWALGDYPAIADELTAPLGPVLVDACGISAGQRVLDVAAGTGNVAIPAARAGAEVVATDLTPELLAAGQSRAGDLPITWQEADAEQLPYEDGSFDVVTSCIGVMFAPHHQQSADELVRVCRPGGTIGVLSWTPGGFVGLLFAAMKPYLPTPPPGAQPPPLWGDPDHVRALLGDRVSDVSTTTATLPVTLFATPQDFREYFATRYGPTVVAYRAVADDPQRRAELDAALEDAARQVTVGDGEMAWDYLVFTARKV